MQRHNLSAAKKEYTTQKIRQEWAEHEEQILGVDGAVAEEWPVLSETATSASVPTETTGQLDAVAEQLPKSTSLDMASATAASDPNAANKVDEQKSKKKRRKKSLMKKKATQRKGSSSSSVGSVASDANDPDADANTTGTTATSSSTEESPKSESAVQSLAASAGSKAEPPRQLDINATLPDTNSVASNTGQQADGDSSTVTPLSPLQVASPAMSRVRDLDIHFFSDTELASAKSPEGSRPSTPIQSDSEFEMSHRSGHPDKSDMLMSGSSASWKWGELPTQGDDTQVATTEDAKQAQRNSMLSNMFSFMKQSKKMRKTSQAEGVYLSDLDTDGMDPEVAALYFPPHAQAVTKTTTTTTTSGKDAEKGSGGVSMVAASADEDRESGNGTSLPHSPSSMDGLKSLDSDYDDGKPGDKQ